jgi:hypothetical protein
MSEFKVRVLDAEEEKSVQELEEQLLGDHEEKVSTEQESQVQNEDKQESQEQTPVIELKEEDVLSFIKNRYNKEINTFEELLTEREVQAELPEDVSAFLKYKQETGRGIQDFIALNRDLSNEDPQKLLLQFYKETQPELDDEDIVFDIQQRFSYDEMLDDETDVRQKKVAMKKELAKAKEHFEKLKEQYKIPVERAGFGASDEEKEQYEAFKSQAQKARELQQEQVKRSEFFAQKTNELFGNEFKGFEFDIEDKRVAFKPADADTLKKSQSDVGTFFQKFLDDSGYVKDAAAYHRAIAVAMNPDSFAKYFYDKGKSDAVDEVARESKNIDMNVKRVPESVSKSGLRITALDSGSSGKLIIKSKK